jgi:hypothetical protein
MLKSMFIIVVCFSFVFFIMPQPAHANWFDKTVSIIKYNAWNPKAVYNAWPGYTKIVKDKFDYFVVKIKNVGEFVLPYIQKGEIKREWLEKIKYEARMKKEYFWKYLKNSQAWKEASYWMAKYGKYFAITSVTPTLLDDIINWIGFLKDLFTSDIACAPTINDPECTGTGFRGSAGNGRGGGGGGAG